MDIRLDQIVFQIINFGVVFGALTYFLYKPVLKLLDDRANKIRQAEEAAAQTLKEREEIDQVKVKTKSQAEKEAEKVLEKARMQAAELKKELTQKLKDEVKDEREKAMKAIELEKKAMRASLQKEIAGAVYLVSEKVIGKSLSKKDHVDLIDKSLKELSLVS